MSNPPYDIDYLLEEVISLPSLPTTVTRIVEMVNDPQCSLAEVAKAISTDPPLAAKTLRLVNTAYYGLRQKVTSIEHAVVLLGVKVIKNLVFTATVFDTIKGGAGAYFRHSVACGLAMRALAEQGATVAADTTGDDAFTYGLLHDIGKIVLEAFLPKEYGLAKSAMLARALTAYDAEREVLGLDHAQVGARLAETWKLSDAVVDAIGGHHDLERCQAEEHRQGASLIAVADYICWQCAIAPKGHTVVHVADGAWEAAGLASDTVPAVLNTFFTELPVLDELIQIAA